MTYIMRLIVYLTSLFKPVVTSLRAKLEISKQLIRTKQAARRARRKGGRSSRRNANKLKRRQESRRIRFTQKRMELGFTETALEELEQLTHSDSDNVKFRACWVLLVWHSNQYTTENAEKCLHYINIFETLTADKPDRDQSRKLAILKAEKQRSLGKNEAIEEHITKCLAQQVHPDLYLAAANLVDSPAEKLVWINKVFDFYNYSPITLESQSNKEDFDHICRNISKNKPPRSQALISIIIPVYNSANTISTAIESILSQTWHNLEILVSDDYSTDNTREIVHKYETRDDRVRLIEAKVNGGTYLARNAALAQAIGEFVTCHDADDWSHPQKLETQAKHLLHNASIIANTSQQIRTRNNLEFHRRGGQGRYIFNNLSSLMFRRQQVMETLGFWDCTRFGADHEFLLRLRKIYGEDNAIDLETGPLSFQRQTETSLTGRSDFGYHGYLFGARKEYREAHNHFSANASNNDLKYPQIARQRRFPIPEPMQPDRANQHNAPRQFDIIIVSDFRLVGEAERLNISEISKHQQQGKRVGLIQLSFYDYVDSFNSTPAIRDALKMDRVHMLVYGERVEAETVIVRFAGILQDWQHFLPKVKVRNISIVLNPDNVFVCETESNQKIDFKAYQEKIDSYFPGDVTWYPENAQVRNKLSEDYGSQLKNFALANTNWIKEQEPLTQKKPLRIAMVVYGFPVLSQTFVALQIAEIVRRGHSVAIYNIGRRGKSEWLPSGVSKEINSIPIYHLGNKERTRKRNYLLLIKILYFLTKQPNAIYLTVQQVLLEKGYREFSRLIADAFLMRGISNSDIVHCQFSTLAPRILELKKLGFIEKQPKIVCSVRGYDITRYQYIKRAYWNTIFNGVDVFTPVCHHFELLMRNMGCKKPITIVPSPINVKHIISNPEKRLLESPVRLVSIGRLVEKKGIIDALAAMVMLKEEGLAFHYSIIGEGTLKDSFIDYVKTHELQDCIQFLGGLPSDETLSILDSSHILIAPSKTAGDGDSEGIPNVLKEAMLMGLQVVSTTHSGIPELIKHEANGFMCAENDPQDLARTIQFIVQHPDQWHAMAERAAITILTEYTPQKTTDNLIEAYQIAFSSSDTEMPGHNNQGQS